MKTAVTNPLLKAHNQHNAAIFSADGRLLEYSDLFNKNILNKQLTPAIDELMKLMANMSEGVWWHGQSTFYDQDGHRCSLSTSVLKTPGQSGMECLVLVDVADLAHGTLLQKLKLVIENADFVTTLYSTDGKPIYISPVAEKIFGYSAEELMSQSPHKGILDEYKQAYFNYVDDVMHCGNRKEGLEFRYRKKDGNVVWLYLKMNSVCDENGKVTHIQSSTHDISAAKHSQELLKKSEENALAITNSSNSAILLINHQHHIISVNDRAKVLALQFFDTSIAEGNDLLEINRGKHRKAYLDGFNRAIKGEVVNKYEKIQLDESHKDIWFHFRYVPVWSSDGSISAVNWTATDVTDEKKAEEYTISLLQRLNLANSAGEIGIWEYNFKTATCRFDDQCLRLFENQIDVKATIANWVKHYKKNYRLTLLKTLAPDISKEKALFDIELELEYEAANVKFHQLKGKIQFKDGKPVAAIGVLIDITNAKAIENNLENSKNQLNLAQRLAQMGGFEYDLVRRKTDWSENNFHIHAIKNNRIPNLPQYLQKVHTDDRQALIRSIRMAATSNKLHEETYRYKLPDREATFNLRIKGVFYRNKLIKMVGTIQDVSDNISLKKSLEHKEAQIDQNLKRLSKYSFMNSHKVRAPLSNILGIIQLLRLDQSTELLDMLERSAEELDQVIHEVNEILSE
ncbi:PAS domain S-box protein [bacterium]|nr:PAS domain S-box protein [bacterium]